MYLVPFYYAYFFLLLLNEDPLTFPVILVWCDELLVWEALHLSSDAK